MKRVLSFVLILVMCLSLTACNTENKEETPKLEGYFISQSNDRYKFTIEENVSSGDYGGEMINMKDTNELHAWYIDGKDVYIDGRKKYFYNGNHMIDTLSEDYCHSISFEGDEWLQGLSYLKIFMDFQLDGWNYKVYKLYEPGGVRYEKTYIGGSGMIFNDHGTYEFISNGTNSKKITLYNDYDKILEEYSLTLDSDDFLTLTDSRGNVEYDGFYIDGTLYDNYLKKYQ